MNVADRPCPRIVVFALRSTGAAQLNIPEVFIEKDYWVTYVLHAIFNELIGEETIFKC